MLAWAGRVHRGEPRMINLPKSGHERFPFNNFTYFLTLFSKFFSSFPHGTCSLSVMHEYLGLESGLPMFRQDFTCPALLKDLCSHYAYGAVTHYGRTFQSVPL